MNNHILTENQLLFLSGKVSNLVQYLTGLPVTESEDAHLAIAIGQWAAETGIQVVPSEEGEFETLDPQWQEYVLEIESCLAAKETLEKRVRYLRENKGDNVAINFALHAPDEEIEALEFDS